MKYIYYFVTVPDPVLLASLQAQYPNGITIPPATFSTLTGIGYVGSPGSTPGTIYFGDGYGLSPLTSPRPGDFGVPQPASFNLIDYAADAAPQAYIFSGSVSSPFWQVGTLTWAGSLGSAASDQTPVGPAPAEVGRRRWVNGFELPTFGEGGAGLATVQNRDASRHLDGFGWAYRADTSGSPRQMFTALVAPFPIISWERIYIRPRTFSVGGNDSFWSCNGDAEGSPSALMTISPTGVITFYNSGGPYPGAAMGTVTIPLNAWSRLDLRINYRKTGPPLVLGGVSLYVDGVLAFSATVSSGNGLNTVQGHVSSQLGQHASQGASFGAELDFDDWISADEFTGIPGILPGFDLTTGSRVQLVRPTGFDPSSSAAWVGDWRTLVGNPQSNSPTTDVLVSSTAGSLLKVTTDYADQQLGCAALVIGCYVVLSSGVAGSIIAANAAATLVSVTKALSNHAWQQQAPGSETQAPTYSVASGQTLPIPNLSAVTLSVTKDPSGSSTVSVQALLAAAEFIGVWGPEDAPGAVGLPNLGLHNAPFPSLSAATVPYAPLGQVAVQSGVYAGNGTGQDVTLINPCHWWFVRDLTGTNAGVFWFSSMEAAHGALAQGFSANNMVQAIVTAMRTAGPDNANNANGSSYQWIAVSDPAMRYMINGACSHVLNKATAANPIIDSTFTPDCAFFFAEKFSGSTTASFFKGIGHAANSASPLDAASNANVAGLATGVVTSLPVLNTGEAQTAYSLWRKNDGTGNVGWFDQFTYTGNGAGGTRSLAAALAGRSPLFAIITPHNGTSYFRDPSNTGTNSQDTSGNNNASTAIVGGDINTIIVGTALNANGIVYDVFVIAGLVNAGNWSSNPGGPVSIVPTLPRTGPPYVAPPTPPVPTPGCISLATGILELASRLGDPAVVHWTVAELTRYLSEALRIWNALTLSARDRGTFVTATATPFYDLPTELPTLRAYTLLDRDLVFDVEYLLQEPPSVTTWIGTPMFTLEQVTAVLNRRRDLFLWESGAVVTRETESVTPDANGRVALPSDVMEVRRAAWISAAGVSPMFRDNEWPMNAYKPTWPTPVAAKTYTPKAYSVGVAPPLVAQLVPPPTAIGTLDTVSVVTGATLNPATGVLLGVPDDFAWVVKWGALADLLSAPGPANDPQRAALASKLWALGIEAATAAAVLLDARVNNVPVRITGIGDSDRYNRSWQNTPGTPKTVLVAGPNLVALSPVPDANGPYTITMDVVRNQPIPLLVTDCYFEGGVGMTAALLDYAEFLARFKEGPIQAEEATALLQSFLTATGVAESLDAAQILISRKALLTESQRNEVIEPRTATPEKLS